MQDKIVVITGANTGIGLETARGLAQQGAAVVLACRNRTKAEAAAADLKASTGSARIELADLDLASLASVRACAQSLLDRFERLDVLINNAGLVLTERQTTVDGFEAQFGINHLGHFLLTHLLRPRLEATPGARVVNLSSMGHALSRGLDFDDLMVERRAYNDMAVYCDSKLANILFTRELARRLQDKDVVAHAVHPGAVASSFAGDGDTRGFFKWMMALSRPFLLSTAKGARTSIHVASSADAGTSTGEYWASRKRRRPSKQARDDAAAARLWTVSEQLVGIAGTG